MTIARRSFITGLISLVAAPAIVRAGSLMPVKLMVIEEPMFIPVHPTIWADLLDAQREINFRRSIAIRHLAEHGLQPYSG